MTTPRKMSMIEELEDEEYRGVPEMMKAKEIEERAMKKLGRIPFKPWAECFEVEDLDDIYTKEMVYMQKYFSYPWPLIAERGYGFATMTPMFDLFHKELDHFLLQSYRDLANNQSICDDKILSEIRLDMKKVRSFPAFVCLSVIYTLCSKGMVHNSRNYVNMAKKFKIELGKCDQHFTITFKKILQEDKKNEEAKEKIKELKNDIIKKEQRIKSLQSELDEAFVDYGTEINKNKEKLEKVKKELSDKKEMLIHSSNVIKELSTKSRSKEIEVKKMLDEFRDFQKMSEETTGDFLDTLNVEFKSLKTFQKKSLGKV